jgi:hypothetical protein
MTNTDLPERILSISANVRIFPRPEGFRLECTRGETITLELESSLVFLARQEPGGWYVLPLDAGSGEQHGGSLAWVLPPEGSSPQPAWRMSGPQGCSILARMGEHARTSAPVLIEVRADWLELTRYENRPRADIFGDRYAFTIQNGARLEEAFAAFYWDTLLPCVVERTRAAAFPTPDGFVLSTLAPNSYGGTYPDVDHEFQIKGRLAAGSALDEDVVRRMMELQFRMMREDPEGLWRNPCAVQGGGQREYHVRRSSLDGSQNAVMFLVTGNVEILEEAWLYTASVKNLAWLERCIPDLEGAASCIEDNIDAYGRLWSDVYYEDQVIQDGRVCDAQAFAARGLGLLADLEQLLGRSSQAAHYRSRAAQLARALIAPLPRGYWDASQRRFTNWVDRSGAAHDHVHLLSNELPALFGFADPAQARAVLNLVDEHLEDFQRFPSFVALDLAGYTPAEIGDGGPYDLCAAGRYWCWDAAFWGWRKDGARLLKQLSQVAAQGAEDGFRMGERYDMDHVYYIDGKAWHGASDYYEYPCVFSWVLLHEYIGVRFDLEADLVLTPRIAGGGSVVLNQKRFALSYQAAPGEFGLINLADRARSLRVDLSALYPDEPALRLEQGGEQALFQNGGILRLQAGESCRFMVG